MVPALLLAATLLADPAGETDCASARAAERVVMGPRDAPVTIRLYLDPTAHVALDTWLQIRGLVGEMKGAVAAELVVVRKADQVWPRTRKPEEDRVRYWVSAASSARDAETMLREIDRLGWKTVSARLAREHERNTLHQRLKIEPASTTPRCLARNLATDSEGLADENLRQLGTSSARPPVFGVRTSISGERLVSHDPNLRELRPQIELALQEVRSGQPRARPRAPDRRRMTLNPRATQPVAGGMNIGGIGLPHHLVVYADGERDPTLAAVLPHAMAFRREFPDRLSLQVVARGRRDDAITLRGRLCAARLAGLEVEYLRRLAGAEPGADDLVDRLDLIAKRENCSVSDPGTNERGAMLDGTPASGADVRQLHFRLEHEARRGPLRWFWPRTDLR
jgi:hypothetical protein